MVPLPKSEKLVQLLIENYGKRGKRRSLGSLLLEAGYSPASAHNPKIILETKTIKEALTPFLETLVNRRNKALEALTDDKIEKESAQKIAYIFDVLSKNTELLSGRPTERVDTLSDEEKQKLDELLDFAHEK